MERVLQRIADVIRVLFALAAVGALLSPNHWHDGIGITLILIASLAVRAGQGPAIFDFTFMTLLFIDSWLTESGAFDHFNKDDRPGHVLLSAAVTPLLFYLAVRLGSLREKPGNTLAIAATAITSAASTVALGTLWELAEWQSDKHFGTNMSLGYADTLGDLLCDVAGGLIGAIIVFALLQRQSREI